MLHRLDGRRESRKLRLLLLADAGALIREPDGVAVVEDGDDDFREACVYEVFRDFAHDRVRNGASCRARLLVYLRREVFYEFSRGGRLYLGDARSTPQIVVQGDSRDGVHAGVIEAPCVTISGIIISACIFNLVVQWYSVFQIRYSAFFKSIHGYCSLF